MSDLLSAMSVGGLIRAAADLDTDAVADAVQTSIASYGVAPTWEWLVSPAWHAVRADPDATGLAERLFIRAVSQVLTAVRRPLDRLPVLVLTACAECEHHVLPLEALAAALAEIGAGSCVLGAQVPPSAVVAAADRLRPAVAVIWSQTGDTADPRPIRTLQEGRPGLDIIAAGPGWDDTAPTVTAALKLTLLRLSSDEPTRRRPASGSGSSTAVPPRRGRTPRAEDSQAGTAEEPIPRRRGPGERSRRRSTSAETSDVQPTRAMAPDIGMVSNRAGVRP